MRVCVERMGNLEDIMGKRHNAIVEIATALHVEGFDAYMVGGVVRALLQDDKNAQKMEVNMATNATPNRSRPCFRRHITSCPPTWATAP